MQKFDLNAGALSLNFINTVWERPGFRGDSPDSPIELLKKFEDLVEWGQLAGVWKKNDEQLKNLSSIKAARELKEVLELRETLFLVCFAVIESKDLERQVKKLNKLIASTTPQMLYLKKDHLVLEADKDLDPLSQLRSKIIFDLVRLLTTEDLSRLKICSDNDCGWVFFDSSKNKSKRWCSMSDCGNRDKVSRFSERQKRLISNS